MRSKLDETFISRRVYRSNSISHRLHTIGIYHQHSYLTHDRYSSAVIFETSPIDDKLKMVNIIEEKNTYCCCCCELIDQPSCSAYQLFLHSYQIQHSQMAVQTPSIEYSNLTTESSDNAFQLASHCSGVL